MNTIEAQKTRISELEASLATANEAVTVAQSAITSLTVERDTARAEAVSLQSDLAGVRAELATANETIAARDTAITGHLAKIGELEKEATTVGKAAARLLSTQGHSPLAITPGPEAKVEAKAAAAKAGSTGKLQAAIEAGLAKSASK